MAPGVANRDIEPAVDAKLDIVDGVVSAAKIETEAEAADERARFLGDTVPVAITIGGEARRMRHIQRVAVEYRAARAVHRREHRVVVRLPVVVAIDEPQDASHARIGLQRAVAVDAHEELAREGGRKTGRVVDDRRRRKHLDLEALRRLDAGEDLGDRLGADGQRAASGQGGHIRRARDLLGEHSRRHDGEEQGGDREATGSRADTLCHHVRNSI